MKKLDYIIEDNLFFANVASMARDREKSVSNPMLDAGMKKILESAGLTDVERMFSDFCVMLDTAVQKRSEDIGHGYPVADNFGYHVGTSPNAQKTVNYPKMKIIEFCDDDCYECTITTYTVHTVEFVIKPVEVQGYAVKVPFTAAHCAKVILEDQENTFVHYPPLEVSVRYESGSSFEMFYNGKIKMLHEGGRVYLEGIHIEFPVYDEYKYEHPAFKRVLHGSYCCRGYPLALFRIDKHLSYGVELRRGMVKKYVINSPRCTQYFVSTHNKIRKYYSFDPPHELIVNGQREKVRGIPKCDKGRLKFDGLRIWTDELLPLDYCNGHHFKKKKKIYGDYTFKGCLMESSYCLLRLLKKNLTSNKISVPVRGISTYVCDIEIGNRYSLLYTLHKMGGYIRKDKIRMDYIIIPECNCIRCLRYKNKQ